MTQTASIADTGLPGVLERLIFRRRGWVITLFASRLEVIW